MRNWGVLLAGLAVLLLPWALRVYLLMPFPGSQGLDSLDVAHALYRARWVLAGAGLSLAGAGLVLVLRGKPSWRGLVALAFLGAGSSGLAWWMRGMSADRMFRPPEQVLIAAELPASLPPETLVLGVVLEGRARAYPVRLLAYHHFVSDVLAGVPVLPTYCTMCRTGRVFSPVIDGEVATFRLVGASFRDAVIEDAATGTWWYQATGRARVGPLAGRELATIPSEQVTLARWLELHPDSDVLAPDPASEAGYRMFGFDRIDSRRPDPDDPGQAPRGPREWVVAVRAGEAVRAYPWSALDRRKWISDELGGVPVLVLLHSDGISFRAFDARLDGVALELAPASEAEGAVDTTSGTRFGFDGVGRGGAHEGRILVPLEATQEFWHAFERFRPHGTRWEGE